MIFAYTLLNLSFAFLTASWWSLDEFSVDTCNLSHFKAAIFDQNSPFLNGIWD